MLPRLSSGALTTCILVLFLCAYDVAAAGNGAIRGVVSDAGTGEKLKGVSIRILSLGQGAISRADGSWTVMSVPEGRYSVQCAYLGYTTQVLPCTVTAGVTSELTFGLVPNPIKTGEVVVSANKRVQAVQDVPLSIAVIQADAIGERTSTKLDEVLRYVPGVNVSQNQVNIRGTSGFAYGLGSRTALLLDNFPLLSADNGDMSFDALPLFATERIEIVKGAGSALYGSGALGGVVNVITKEPSPEASIRLRVYEGRYTPLRYDDWDWSSRTQSQRGVDAGFGQSFGQSSIVVAGGVRTDDTHLQASDSKRSNVYAKFSTQPSATSRLMVFAQFAYEDRANWVNWKSVAFATRPAPTVDSGLRIFSNKASLGAEWSERLSESTFLVSRVSRFQTWYRNTAIRDSASFMSSDAGASSAEFQLTSQVRPDLALTAGATLTLNDVVSPQTRGTKNQSFISAYAQGEWNVTREIITTLGARFDRENTVGESVNNEFSPKLGMSYKMSESSTLRMNVGRSFRAPALLERYASIRFAGFTVGRNPLLRPEIGWSAEIGADWTTSLGALPVRFEGAVFHNELSDLIEPQFVIDAVRPEIQFINITKARIQGLEGGVQFRLFPWLGIESSLTALAPRNITTGKDLLFRHNIMLVQRLLATWGDLQFNVDYRYLSRQREIDERLGNLGLVVNADIRVPVHVVDMRLIYDMATLLATPLRVTLNARNLLDYYYVEVPGNLAPTRSVTLQIDLEL